MRETRLALVARLVVGGLVLLEASLVLCAALFVGVVGGVTGLASGAGAGDVAGPQAPGLVIAALALVAPLVMAGALGVAGVGLLFRSRRRLVVAPCALGLVVHAALHLLLVEPPHALELLPLALQGAAIAVALRFLPATQRAASPRAAALI